MKKTILFGIVIMLLLTGCNLMSVEVPPEEKGNKIVFDGVTFTYKQLPIRNWKARTDEFKIDETGCLLMQGNSYVSNTFYESNFRVFTDLDLCAYQYIKINSTIKSITKRESISPSSQIHLQDIKYSSGSMDNLTKYLHSHNLRFYNDGTRVSWIDDEGISHDSMCGNLTIEILASGGENGTALASMLICNIDLGPKTK